MRHIEQLRTVDCRKSKNTLYKFIASCTLEVARNSNLCLLMSHSLKFQDLDGTESPCRKTSEILNLCEAQNYVLMQSAFSSCAKLLWFVLPLANIWNCDNSLHHLGGEGGWTNKQDITFSGNQLLFCFFQNTSASSCAPVHNL